MINKYLAKLGFPVTMYEAVEVMSTDDWALDMVPKPVVGVLMLFPIKDASEAHKAAEDARIKAEGQTLAPEVWYTKQTVGNACGTIGLVHIAANVTSFAGSDVVPISAFVARRAVLRCADTQLRARRRAFNPSC